MSKISAIIFDLGGVILNLDPQRTTEGFKALGFDMDNMGTGTTTMFHDFEKGLITEDDFRQHVRALLQQPVTDVHIHDAWNSMLLDLPAERIAMLKALRKRFKLYLLSNTNVVHIRAFDEQFKQAHAQENWMDLFDHVYYSYEMGMRKPDKEIYEFVLDDVQLKGDACIFIDDNEQNLVAAAACGIHVIHAKAPLSNLIMQEIERISA